MKEDSEIAKLYRRKERRRKARAKRPVSEKLEIASRLREVQQKRAAGKVDSGKDVLKN
jgi:hypothetical protein